MAFFMLTEWLEVTCSPPSKSSMKIRNDAIQMGISYWRKVPTNVPGAFPSLSVAPDAASLVLRLSSTAAFGT